MVRTGVFEVSFSIYVVKTTEFGCKYVKTPRCLRNFPDFRGDSLIFWKSVRILRRGQVFLMFHFRFTLLKQRNSFNRSVNAGEFHAVMRTRAAQIRNENAAAQKGAFSGFRK